MADARFFHRAGPFTLSDIAAVVGADWRRGRGLMKRSLPQHPFQLFVTAVVGDELAVDREVVAARAEHLLHGLGEDEKDHSDADRHERHQDEESPSAQ